MSSLPPQQSLYLEQYKAYLTDLGNIGSRYGTTNAFYLSVITALLGVLALSGKDRGFAQLDVSLVFIVCGFGVLLCLIWFATIWYFSTLFRAKFAVLRQLESRLAHPSFANEYLFLRRARALWWTRTEKYIPLAMGAFLAAIVVLRLLA